MNPGARKLLTVITSLAGLTLAYKILQGPRHLEPAELSERKGHRECSKKTKIAFLKTHKCASSSVQNMLMRFGLDHELNFVLPSAGNYLGRCADAYNFFIIPLMSSLLSCCCQVCALLPGDGG